LFAIPMSSNQERPQSVLCNFTLCLVRVVGFYRFVFLLNRKAAGHVRRRLSLKKENEVTTP
jgi:hypothetical protein